jgi:hypothetical protein
MSKYKHSLKQRKSRAYVSHSIRGKHGKDATDEQMEENNEKAKAFGRLLSKEFPTIDFYVPGEHDELVLIAYRKDYLTEEQILDVDCDIVSRCNFLIVYSPDDYISRGMQVEVDHAVRNNIPIISAIDGSYEQYVKRIIYAINCHLISMMR